RVAARHHAAAPRARLELVETGQKVARLGQQPRLFHLSCLQSLRVDALAEPGAEGRRRGETGVGETGDHQVICGVPERNEDRDERGGDRLDYLLVVENMYVLPAASG